MFTKRRLFPTKFDIRDILSLIMIAKEETIIQYREGKELEYLSKLAIDK